MLAGWICSSRNGAVGGDPALADRALDFAVGENAVLGGHGSNREWLIVCILPIPGAARSGEPGTHNSQWRKAISARDNGPRTSLRKSGDGFLRLTIWRDDSQNEPAPI